jgi:hypothetical protein
MGRNVSIILCTIFFLLSCSTREQVSIKKVEHFYISSNNAMNIFQILTEQFGLPVVWDYQDWGGFSSGGITLGNVVLELIEGQASQSQTHYGIALEPSQSLKRTISFLDSAHISHGRISRAADWSTMSLKNLLPDNIDLFLCDYHDREFIRLDRKRAIDTLVLNNGGALGIQFLKEIVIGTEYPAEFEKEWAKIPGLVKKGNEFHFPEGPNLKLIPSDSSFFALTIKVKSIHKANLELEALGLRTRISEHAIELIDALFATSISLVE